MKPEAHGGDLLRMAATAGRDPASLLDFSVNVRPEGPPEFIRAALFRAMTALAAYPSPHAEEAMLAAARHHGMDASRFVFGSGSNELIHALARVLRKRGVPSVRVVEPAFSEYAIACRLAGIKAIPVWGGIIEKNQCVPTTDTGKDEAVPTRDLLDALTDAPEGSAVFLANPGNPSGLFRTPEECLRLMSSRSDLLWIIDEAFVEYAGTETEASVLQRLPKNGIVLRSLTKFHAVPGVRLGYLAADAELAQAIRDELPAWSVNAFALAAAQAVFADTSNFAAQTRAENAERRADLAAALSSLPGIEVYPSAANYVLFRWPGAPRNLLDILLKRFGIAVRDCSNYHGLKDGSWFRAAVRFPEDHRRLAEALSAIRETMHGVSSSPLPETPASPESGNKDSINIKVLGRGGMGVPPGSPFSIQTFHKNVPPGYAPDRPADPRGPTSGIGGSVRHDTQRLTARLHQRQLPPVAVNAPADDGRSQCPGTAGRLGVGRPGPAYPYKRRNPQAGRFTMKPDAPGGILTQQPETGKQRGGVPILVGGERMRGGIQHQMRNARHPDKIHARSHVLQRRRLRQIQEDGGLETVGGQTPDADAQAFRHPGYAHDPAKPAAFRAELPLFGKQRRKGTGRVHAELPAHHVQPRDGSGGVHIPGLLRFQMPRRNDFGGDAGPVRRRQGGLPDKNGRVSARRILRERQNAHDRPRGSSGFRIIRHFDQVSVRVTEIHGGNGPEGAFAPHRPLFHRDTIGFEVIQHFNGRRPGKEAQIRRARKRIVGLREIPLAHFMKIDLTVAERKGGAPVAERERRHAEHLLIKTARSLDVGDCKHQMIEVFHAKNGHRHPILLLD